MKSILMHAPKEHRTNMRRINIIHCVYFLILKQQQILFRSIQVVDMLPDITILL